MINFSEIGPRIIFYFGDGKIYITESTCYAVIVAVILAIVGIWMGRGLEKIPKGKQIVAEAIVSWVYNFVEENMGEEYKKTWSPYLGSLIIWLIFCNSLGLLGLRPVTADINVTAGLALASFVIIQVSAIAKLGLKGRYHGLAQPYSFMIVMELISAVILPMTLALRLFGNIFGGMIVIDLWMHLMEYLSAMLCSVPFLRFGTVIPLNLFFDMFEPLIQAYIFTMLTTVNLKEALEGESPENAERRRLKKEQRLARKQKKQISAASGQ